jgi:hypothetical protein
VRPKASVVATSPRAVTSRTPGRPRSPESWTPLRLASSKTLPITSVQEKVGSATTRTLAAASPESGAPVTLLTACARFTYSPSLTPAPTASSRRRLRLLAAPIPRFGQVSTRPSSVGSIGTPSMRADPST